MSTLAILQDGRGGGAARREDARAEGQTAAALPPPMSVGVRGIEPSFSIVSGLLPLFSILFFSAAADDSEGRRAGCRSPAAADDSEGRRAGQAAAARPPPMTAKGALASALLASALLAAPCWQVPWQVL